MGERNNGHTQEDMDSPEFSDGEYRNNGCSLDADPEQRVQPNTWSETMGSMQKLGTYIYKCQVGVKEQIQTANQTGGNRKVAQSADQN